MNTEPRELDLTRLIQSVTGRELSGLPTEFVAPVTGDHPVFEGTVTRALGVPYMTRPSGLFVPADAYRPPIPMDQVHAYMTHKDVTGQRVSATELVAVLAMFPLRVVLSFTSYWLAETSRLDADRRAIDQTYLDLHFTDGIAARFRRLLAEGRCLVVPQLMLILAKLALFWCHAEEDPGRRDVLGFLPLVVADCLSPEPEEDPDVYVHYGGLPGRLTREVISNQHFNAPLDIAHLAGRFTRRWIQLPTEQPHPTLGSLEGLFTEATGITVDELTTVVLAIWSHVTSTHQPGFGPGYLDQIGLPAGRAQAVVKFLSVTAPRMRELIREDQEELRAVATEWSFSPFERFPLLSADDGGVLVLSPRLLLGRVFGWLPFWDIRSYLSDHDPRREAAFNDYFRRLTETYVLEVLASMTPTVGAERRLYTEADLKKVVGRRQGVKIVDAVIDYGDTWIVLDVATHQLKREAVTGVSAEAIVSDVTKLVVAKAKQISSTIALLRQDEERLTNHPAIPNRKFVPLVIASEGFPVSPVMSSLIEDRLVDEGLLQEHDTGMLQVISTVELEMVESIQEQGGPSLADLLRDKSSASLGRSSLRDYILVERRLTPERPTRLDGLWPERFHLAREIIFSA